MNWKLLLGLGLLSLAGAGQERFDYKVREDFFAGLAGDREATARAMKACEQILATEPNHPEALVWHGSGLHFQAAARFQKGDFAAGQEMAARGIQEMDRAVELAPKSVAVRVPRGAYLLAASRFVPLDQRKMLLEKGLSDYEVTYQAQKEEFEKLGEHSRGELLFGLAEGYARLGNNDRARSSFEQIIRDLKGTEYAKRAALWMEKGSLPVEKTRCVGCHAKE